MKANRKVEKVEQTVPAAEFALLASKYADIQVEKATLEDALLDAGEDKKRLGRQLAAADAELDIRTPALGDIIHKAKGLEHLLQFIQSKQPADVEHKRGSLDLVLAELRAISEAAERGLDGAGTTGFLDDDGSPL